MCPNHESLSEHSSSRRGFLFKLGLALNALGAVLVGIPVVGYILAPARRLGGGESWIKLGGVDSFPVGQTRFAQYENPFRVQWDGASAKVACWVRRVEGQRFQVFAVNCAHLGTAAARALRVPVRDPRGPALGPRRPASHPRRPSVRRACP